MPRYAFRILGRPLYDRDFNQMLELPIVGNDGEPMNVRDVDTSALGLRRIVTDRHCFGCIADAESSCSGSLA